MRECKKHSQKIKSNKNFGNNIDASFYVGPLV